MSDMTGPPEGGYACDPSEFNNPKQDVPDGIDVDRSRRVGGDLEIVPTVTASGSKPMSAMHGGPVSY